MGDLQRRMHTGMLVTRTLQAKHNCEYRTRDGSLVNSSSLSVRSRFVYKRESERHFYRLAL